MAKPNMMQIGEPRLEADLPKYDIQFLGEDNPRAIVNIVPNSIKEAINLIAKDYPQYLGMSETEIYKDLKPSDMDDRIRLGFWNEYARAQDSERRMVIKNICAGICSLELFNYYVVNNPKRMAWILNPPQDYMQSLEASLSYGKTQLDKLIKMNLFDHGKLKLQEAKIFLEAYKLLDARVKGAVLQRIEQKSATLHLHKKLEGDSAAVADLQNEIEAEVVNGKD